jgi:hypothetical protein
VVQPQRRRVALIGNDAFTNGWKTEFGNVKLERLP